MPTIEETALAVAKAKADLEAAEAEHLAALDEGEANKTPSDVAYDLLDEIVMKLGNRPPMRVLMDRIRRALDKAPAPPTAAPEFDKETFTPGTSSTPEI